jgi:hypothetical protein
MCNSADLAGKDATHCVAGYHDGYYSTSVSRIGSSSIASTHHTAAYWTGYNQGKLDRQNGTPETPLDMCQSADLTGMNADHCVAGYNDGYNVITP